MLPDNEAILKSRTPGEPGAGHGRGVAAIEARGLLKTYPAQAGQPAQQALKGIDLTIARGALFGLLGPNGAGKSTFINIVGGLTVKSGGHVAVWGFDIDANPRQARASVGVVPQELHIDPFFTPFEILELQAGLYGIAPRARRTAEILRAFQLEDKAGAYARTLSGGMRRRLMVVKAMVHDPPILVLDEPTAGVDVDLRHQLWEEVRRLNREGVTVVLTTHYLEEAEALCERIAIIDHGAVVAQGTKQELLELRDSKRLTVTADRALPEVPAGLAQALAGRRIEADEAGRLHIHYRPERDRISDILGALAAAGVEITDLSTRETALEDVFLQLTRLEEG